MKNKNGFTLIELLAVIVILSVLMLIAIPAVLNIMNKSKVNAFRDQTQSILKTAQTQWASNVESAAVAATYSDGGTKLDLSGNKNLKYNVAVNVSGQVTSICVSDGAYSVNQTGTAIDTGDIKSSDVIKQGDSGYSACP